MPTTSEYIGIGVAVLIIVAVLVAVIIKSKKHAVRQGWGFNQIGMGYYPPSIDPSALGQATGGAVFSFMPKTTASNMDGKNLVAQWYAFADQLDPNVREAIYALFPDLQTEQSLTYYGVSDKFIQTLKRIAPKLVNPGAIKTMDDVNRIFSADAVQQFSRDVNIRPQSGLYNDIKSYGNFINVA